MNRIYYNREAQERAERERLLLVLVAMVFGMAWGVVMALLFAPESGEEIRRRITDQVEKVADQGRELGDQVGRDLRKTANNVRDGVNDRLHASGE